MADTPAKKAILVSIRDILREALHVVLIPVLAVCKFINKELTALITELSKV